MSDRLRIVRIVLEGVKAFDRDLALSHLNLLLGEPGSGKSSVADALRFAALGRIPALGGREADTARILRGGRMVVRVELSDGRWFTRSLGRDGAAIRTEARASWLPAGATNTAHAGAIRGLFGESDAEASEHLDLRELLDATPSERAARLDALLAATAAKPEDLAAHVEALTVARLAKLDEARVPADAEKRRAMIAGLFPTLEAGWAAVLPVAVSGILGALRGKGMASALELANAEKRTASENVRRRTAAAAELEDRARAAVAPAATLADLDKRRQAATDRLAVVRSDRERVALGRAAKDSALEAVAKAKRPTADHEDLRASIASARADAERWEKQAAELFEPAEVPAPNLATSSPDVEDRARTMEADEARLLDEATQRDAALYPEAPPAVKIPTTDAEEAEVTRATEALAKGAGDPWARVSDVAYRIVREAEAYEGRGFNPGPFRDAAHELRTLAKANGADLSALGAAVQAAEKALHVASALAAKARKRAKVAGDAYAEAVTAWNLNREAAQDLRQKAAKLNADARALRADEARRLAEANAGAKDAYHAAAAKRAAEVDRIRSQRASLLDRAGSTRSGADEDERSMAAEAAELAAAQARLDGIGDVEPLDLGAADDEITALQTAIAVLDADKRAVAGADARARELGELTKAIAEAQSARVVWTEAEWALLRLRELDLSSRGEPILARMRAFLRGAGRTEIPYLRATKAATDFGWRRGGVELAVEALSGGETVLFTTALASAVIALRRPTLRVLIVEAAELGDREAASAVLGGVAAVADELELAVVATCANVSTPNGWTGFTFTPAGVVPTDRR